MYFDYPTKMRLAITFSSYFYPQNSTILGLRIATWHNFSYLFFFIMNLIISGLTIYKNHYVWYFPNIILWNIGLSNLNLVILSNCDKNSGMAKHLPVLLYHQLSATPPTHTITKRITTQDNATDSTHEKTFTNYCNVALPPTFFCNTYRSK